MAKKRVKLSDQVRRAVDESGLSRYAICKSLGLAQATLSRFMSGKGGLSMDSLDALAGLLDLNITAGRATKEKARP
jgi:transcriptional regulator with XRE-family HTH domain